MKYLKTQIGWLISKLLYEWNPLKKRRQFRFYRQFISPDDWCFDVGAHLGDRSATWLKLGAKVLAIEPQPRFAKYLEKKFSAHSNFHLLQAGLGATPGRAELWVSHLYPTLSSFAGQQWADDLKSASPLTVHFDETIQDERSRFGWPDRNIVTVAPTEHAAGDKRPGTFRFFFKLFYMCTRIEEKSGMSPFVSWGRSQRQSSCRSREGFRSRPSPY